MTFLKTQNIQGKHKIQSYNGDRIIYQYKKNKMKKKKKAGFTGLSVYTNNFFGNFRNKFKDYFKKKKKSV